MRIKYHFSFCAPQPKMRNGVQFSGRVKHMMIAILYRHLQKILQQIKFKAMLEILDAAIEASKQPQFGIFIVAPSKIHK